MKKDTASRTAQYMALFRALETTLPANKQLFTDEYAHLFLDNGLLYATYLSKLSFIHNSLVKYINSRAPGTLSSGIARTRYIDDLLENEINKGIKQVIILGAGFDTRAQRLGYLKLTAVIEIDHPDTSRYKTEILKSYLGKLPENVRYCTINFNSESLDDLATRQNIDLNQPTCFIWEGVTNYLPQQAVDKTFGFISHFATGSSVIFTYIDKHVMDAPQDYIGVNKVKEYLNNSEERWTLGFVPTEMDGYMKSFNLTLISDKDAVEYRKRYMPERKNILQGYEFYHVALAKILF